MRDQKRMEKASPAKNVDAARATLPLRMLRIAEAVQQNMIATIKMMSSTRKRAGVNMGGR
jgi:hypothetical protein